MIIQEIWHNITASQRKDLINTIHKRIRAVLAAKGDVTQYKIL